MAWIGRECETASFRGQRGQLKYHPSISQRGGLERVRAQPRRGQPQHGYRCTSTNKRDLKHATVPKG
eukprot:27206-Hanusia_phi.AAC.2